ncbi:hypothetical protein LWI29_025492 [Acer saccharum]|uniref:Uncharacterized protein n=1 Tax=Acer saccharum TaxID=4024 RepID=A0AA39RRF6_ACESA|nr:hypothetical protein LWI29_025492 [Acer saccharum]
MMRTWTMKVPGLKAGIVGSSEEGEWGELGFGKSGGGGTRSAMRGWWSGGVERGSGGGGVGVDNGIMGG